MVGPIFFISPNEEVISYSNDIVQFAIDGVNALLMAISSHIGTEGHPKVVMTSKWGVESC